MEHFRCTLVFAIFLFALSCKAPVFIHDDASAARQRQLQKRRATNIVGNSVLSVGSVALAAITGVYVGYIPEENLLRKIKLQNTSGDTLRVNMLTDYPWDTLTYCDFMDIRIPPQSRCRLLVPTGAVYNVYFSNTPAPGDDEMIEFNSNSRRTLRLSPGMTLPVENDSISFLDN